MPRTYITQEQRNRAKLSAWIFGCLKTTGTTQAELAARLGCTQQAISRKLREQRFSYDDMVVIFEVFKPDARELDTLLGIDRYGQK